MRRIALITLSILVVLVALIVLLPFVVPVDAYKSKIEDEATAATGRQLKIEGPLHLSVFPQLGLTAEKVTLANAPGGQAPYLASMDRLEVGVRLLPLLGGRLEVSAVTLDRPAIHLEAARDGSGNWVLGKTATGSGSAEGGGAGMSAERASFQGVFIKDGTLTYRDAASGRTRRLEHVNLSVGITRFDAPLTIDGSLVAEGEKISLDGRIDSLRALMKGTPTPVDLSLTSPLVQASFKGALARDGGQGLLKLDTQSLRKLAAWAGNPLGPGGGLGRLSLEGQLSAQGKVDRFSAIKLVLDKMTMKGALTLDRTGPVPLLTGQLAIDRLNLNAYLAGGAQGANAPANPPPAETQGWSRRPIDLSILKTVNARLTLETGSLSLRKLSLGKTRLALTLNGGALTANLDPVTLYGGSGKAVLRVRTAGGMPEIANTLKFDNLAARPFLTDALGVSRIEGTGSVALDVTARGRSPNAIMHALDGKGAITFVNGKLRGVDLAAVARTIQTALTGAATASNASTDFTEMGGTFTVKRGVMTSKDFHLLSPFVRLTGAGNIDLGEQTIDFVVEPKAVGSIKGQGGKQNLAGLGVPFRIHGAWTNLHYTPDLSGVATDILQSVSKGGISSKSVLEGLFGGGSKDKPQNSDTNTNPQKKKKSPLDALKGILGGH